MVSGREIQNGDFTRRLARLGRFLIASRWWKTCLFLLLLVYAVGAAIRQEQVHSHYVDFDQFYYGAMIARSGSWDLLYPIPQPNASRNAGFAADQKPAALAFWQRVKGETKNGPNFIYPPAAALLLLPLALVDYPTAKLAWQIISGVSIWGIGILTGRIYRVLQSHSGMSWIELAIVVCLVLAPRSVLELNHGNISQMIGLLNAGAILALLKHRPVTALLLILCASGLKVSPACLLILFATEPARAAGRYLAVGSAILAAGIAVTGWAVWTEYFSSIAPTLSRTWLPEYPGDEATASIHGMIGLLTADERLSTGWAVGIKILTAVTLLAQVLGYLRDLERLRRDRIRYVGFAAGIVAWSLLFSPILWYHYWYYYLFSVPWLLSYFRRIGPETVLALFALFLMFGPWGKIPPFNANNYAARLVPGWICLTLLVLSLLEGWWPTARELKAHPESTSNYQEVS